MLTKCIAQELGPEVRVNGIGLGFVESPLVHEVFSTDQLEEVIKSTPLGRMTTIEETSAFVRLLASESTLKNYLPDMTIFFKRLSHLKNLVRKMIRIRRRGLRRISKVFTTWNANSHFRTRHTSPPPATSKTRSMINSQRTFP